jgi:hypothetical protein
MSPDFARPVATRCTRPIALLSALLLVPWSLVAQQPAPAVADNSFLIEEAYNQEPGVVQHINAMAALGPDRNDLFYTFTQEWPFLSQRHQLSYTLPVSRFAGQAAGVGDILLNYRLQLGAGDKPWAVAPRLSAVLPTGKVDRGLGDGTLGVQVNLPVSYQITSDIVTHWNAGLTLLPRAKGPEIGGEREHATVVNYNLGASFIAPTSKPLQLVVEGIGLFEGEVGADGGIERGTTWIFNPGVRAALNLGSLQVVPGLSVPFSRAAGDTETGLFFYLSFEHPFRAIAE